MQVYTSDPSMENFHLYTVLLVLVVTVAAAPSSSQEASSDQNRNVNCNERLTQCERELRDLRKQRVRARQLVRKLEYRSWNLGEEKKFLEQEILIYRYQIEHPNMTVPSWSMSGKGTGVWQESPEIITADGNCTTRLSSCQSNKRSQQERTLSFQESAATHLLRISEQTIANNELKDTIASLKAQLQSQGVTPHPFSQYDLNIGRSGELFDLNSEEVEQVK
ncbi:hypothetical protein B566_EDAN000633 [Ephemera danica]|nr:hypothetical protein B566_EDAN000633 [Ephemera danica]